MALGDHGDTAYLAQQFDFLIQRRVRVRFAGEDEVTVQLGDQLTERLMTVEIIAQQGQRAGGEAAGVPLQPALSRPQLTILFLAAILRRTNSGSRAITRFSPGATISGATNVCA